MCLYYSHKMCLLATLRPITDGNDRFPYQSAMKVVSNSPGLVDFAIGLVIFVLNLPDRQMLFFFGGAGWNSNYRRTVINPANQNLGFGAS